VDPFDAAQFNVGGRRGAGNPGDRPTVRAGGVVEPGHRLGDQAKLHEVIRAGILAMVRAAGSAWKTPITAGTTWAGRSERSDSAPIPVMDRLEEAIVPETN
jgi:hypothetical protein